MIGYIRIFKPELKYKEFLVYNSYYCGICKALGDRYGLIYRNFINYDAVFIAILLDSAFGKAPEHENFRCILHPTKKKYRCCSSESIDYAADLTVLMTNAKLNDNIIDDNDFLAKSGKLLMKKGFEKAENRLLDISKLIESDLKKLHELEAAESDNIDMVSGCYGNIIRNILLNGSNRLEINEQIGWIGFQIGKWVYLADAWTDLEKDIKRKNYNPLLKRFKYSGENISIFKNSIKERVGFILFASLDEMAATFEEIDKKINSGIIRNILYEGLFSLTDKILNGVNENNATKESL